MHCSCTEDVSAKLVASLATAVGDATRALKLGSGDHLDPVPADGEGLDASIERGEVVQVRGGGGN